MSDDPKSDDLKPDGPARAMDSASHMRWVADKLATRYSDQTAAMRALEKKALISLGWMAATVAISVRLFPGASLQGVGLVWVLILGGATLGCGIWCVIPRNRPVSNELNYWNPKHWTGYSEAKAARGVVETFQEVILTRNLWIKRRAVWVLLTQIGSIATITLAIVLLATGDAVGNSGGEDDGIHKEPARQEKGEIFEKDRVQEIQESVDPSKKKAPPAKDGGEKGNG